MDRNRIIQEINSLRRENAENKSKINRCERAITRLNEVYESLNESLNQINKAERYLESNIIDNKVADKGNALDCITNLKKAKGKIEDLISKIRSKISNYNDEVKNNENRIENLKIQLQNTN